MKPSDPFPNGKSAFFYVGVEAVRDPDIVNALEQPVPLVVIDDTEEME